MPEYHKGGYIAPADGASVVVYIHPDECIGRAVDARTGRFICERDGHPTKSSGCAPR